MFEKGSRFHDDGPDAIEGAVWMLNFKTRVDLPLIIGKRNRNISKCNEVLMQGNIYPCKIYCIAGKLFLCSLP